MSVRTTPKDAKRSRSTFSPVRKRVRISDAIPIVMAEKCNSSILSPSSGNEPTAEQSEGAISEPRVIEKMLNNISTYLQTQESELCKLKEILIKLETTLTSERDKARVIARDQREKLVRERAELDSYVSAITNQALDITTGICNVSGKQIPKADKIYVMERCGAPVCSEVAEANTLRCPIHPSEGVQKVHAVYSRECDLCNGNDPKKLIDTNCGHTTCIECLEEWAEGSSPEFLDVVYCHICGDVESLDTIMQRPTLRHEQSRKRSRASWL